MFAKLNAFLPAMEAANAKLKEDLKVLPADALNIEHIEEEDQPYIEMVCIQPSPCTDISL